MFYAYVALVNMPSAENTLTSISAWSSPFFDSLFPIAMVGVGIVLAGGLAFFLVRVVSYALGYLLNSKDK